MKYLIKNQDFGRKVLPYIKPEYFSDRSESIVFAAIRDYILKYNRPPTFESLLVYLDSTTTVDAEEKEQYRKVVGDINQEEFEQNQDWLVDATEKFCQERSLYNAMVQALEIMEGKRKNLPPKTAIPSMVQDALAVTFDPSVGHDYFEDAEARYEAWHAIDAKIPFDIDILNTITNGGVPDKTFNVLVGGINVGKTLILCHLAASYISMGYDVLYITMEMAEERISERIDANLLNLDLQDLNLLSKDAFLKKSAILKAKTQGKLIVKEFPTASASVLHFKALINELKLKKNFTPKILIIDYINICASSRLKMGGSVNTYLFIKFVAEELRGLAVEMKLRVWTATQLTREGFSSSDPDMTDVAESFGLPATADFMLIVISDDTLEKLGQYLLKQIKNRYNQKVKNKTVTVGVDYGKQRIYSIAQDPKINPPEQTDTPVFESSNFNSKNKSKFNGLKV